MTSDGQDDGTPDGERSIDLSEEARSQEGPTTTSAPSEGMVVGPPVSPQVGPPEEAPFEEVPITRRLIVEETVRASLAFSFVALLLATVLLAFMGVNGGHWANTKELLELLLPAETALLGSAVGFYFGSRSK